MKKTIKTILINSLIIFGLIGCEENNYVEYKPHYLSDNNEQKYYGESELDSLEFKNIIQVLKFYNVDYKIRNKNIILITKELNKDWSLLWNYTSKANDVEWLKSHIPKAKNKK